MHDHAEDEPHNDVIDEEESIAENASDNGFEYSGGLKTKFFD